MLLLPRIFGINQATNFVITLILSLVLSVLTGFILNRNIKTRLAALPMPALLSAIALILTPLSSNIMDEIREAKSDKSVTVSVNYLQTPRLDKITTEMEALAKTAKESAAQDEPVNLASVSPNDASVLVIGDSVTLGAKAALESKIMDVYVDAEESRGIEKAHTILDTVAASGDVPPIVIVSLTTMSAFLRMELCKRL